MKSTIIVALDQHAATTVAAVLLPGQRIAALHSLTSIVRRCSAFLSASVARARYAAVTRPAPAASSCSAR